MPVPVFTSGEILTAANMNAVGLWRITGCTVTSVGGTAATASNGVITIGTGNTSITVSNAFSADFDNYKIEIYVNDTNGANSHEMALSGNATNYYVNGAIYAWGVGAVTSYGPAVRVNWIMDANTVAATASHMAVELAAPFLTKRTFGTSMAQGGNGDVMFNLLNSNATSSTGFTLSKAGNTMTGGTIRVYGYNN